MTLFQHTELYWQQPGYDKPSDEDIADLEAEFEDDDLDFDDDEEFFERGGMTFCGACGILACPGEEEFDWCSHLPSERHCYHMRESVFDDDDEWDDGRDD